MRNDPTKDLVNLLKQDERRKAKRRWHVYAVNSYNDNQSTTTTSWYTLSPLSIPQQSDLSWEQQRYGMSDQIINTLWNDY